MNIGYYIDQLDQQLKLQDAIYHSAAVKCGLSDSAMWVLYVVSESGRDWTQQDLCRQCFFAKQTVNTAIANLVKGGFMKLEVLSGTRNQKRILLTEQGRALAAKTTACIRAAELRAYAVLGEDELQACLCSMQKLTAALRYEIEQL